MHKVLGIITVVLLSAAVALAEGRPPGKGPQDKDDHDDRTPVQSGYAVVTPSTTSGTGLVVFETFGWRRGGDAGTPQAGVLPPGLTTNAVLFVDSKGKLSKNLGLATVNPNSSNVNVSMLLRDSNGSQLGATKIVNIPSHQQVVTFVTQIFSGTSIPRDVTGTLAITSAGSSNLPVSVMGLRFRGSNFSTVPITDLSGNPGPLPTIATGVGGTGAVLLPQFVTGGGWATELVLMNTGTGIITVRVDLFNSSGNPLSATLNGHTASSFTNLNISPGGVVILAPRDPNGDDDF